ncbi:MAG: hypothetical protein ABJD07_05700 [Gemmatimonadaceae bacterium]
MRVGVPFVTTTLFRFAAAALVLAGTAAAAPLASQGRDSIRALRTAQSAQAAFESRRRAALPITGGLYSYARHESIGRIAYYHNESDTPPSDPPSVKQARDHLLEELASAARNAGSDPWIAGQRVRYLVEAERHDDAIAAARECRASGWWCDALLGVALHEHGEFADAEATFRRALAAMPDAERCRFTDIRVLLVGDVRERYEKTPCAARDSLDAHIWWLSQPLYSIGANDRRTEHYSRVMLTRLQENAKTTIGMTMGDDLAESWVRYGWPRHFSQATPLTSSTLGGPPSNVIEHETAPAFPFLPASRAIANPFAADASDWRLDDEAPHSRYGPSYARTFAALPYSILLFKRGDSAVVVAAYDFSRDTALRRAASDTGLSAALAITRDAAAPPEVSRDVKREGTRGIVVAHTAWSPFLASVEVLSRDRRAVARGRAGVRLPPGDGVTLSGLALLRDSLPDTPTLESAIGAMRTSDRVRRDERLGLYWEVYGLDRDTSDAAVSVTVTPVGRGWLLRATDALGITAPSVPARFIFSQQHDGTADHGTGTLVLGLKELEPGRYRIDVIITSAGAERGRVSRDIELIP